VKTKLISNLLSHMSTTSSRLLSYRIFRTLPVATVVSLYILLKFRTIRERDTCWAQSQSWSCLCIVPFKSWVQSSRYCYC